MREVRPLVSIGLPVRNGADTIEPVVKSVLGQSHENLELVISDNASDDGTEELCRRLARSDRRIAYYRQTRDVGINRNFTTAITRARGTYFRWIGDEDWLDPDYVARCLDVFRDADELVLVSTQQRYELPDGRSESARYHESALRSSEPIERFAEMLRLLTEGFAYLDPSYSMVRRAPVAALRRYDMLREDEVFAARLALLGPWGHVPEVLAGRPWTYASLPELARRLNVPAWQAWAPTANQCRVLLAVLREFDLTPVQRRRGRRAIAQLYLHRLGRLAQRGGRKIRRLYAAGSA